VYKRLNVVVGDTVELICNTSLSAHTMWTYDNDTEDGYVHYVDWEEIANRPRLFVKVHTASIHSLNVDDAEPTDSGLYNCYDDKGSRQVGYQLIVNGMFFFSFTGCAVAQYCYNGDVSFLWENGKIDPL